MCKGLFVLGFSDGDIDRIVDLYLYSAIANEIQRPINASCKGKRTVTTLIRVLIPAVRVWQGPQKRS